MLGPLRNAGDLWTLGSFNDVGGLGDFGDLGPGVVFSKGIGDFWKVLLGDLGFCSFLTGEVGRLLPSAPVSSSSSEAGMICNSYM